MIEMVGNDVVEKINMRKKVMDTSISIMKLFAKLLSGKEALSYLKKWESS